MLLGVALDLAFAALAVAAVEMLGPAPVLSAASFTIKPSPSTTAPSVEAPKRDKYSIAPV